MDLCRNSRVSSRYIRECTRYHETLREYESRRCVSVVSITRRAQARRKAAQLHRCSGEDASGNQAEVIRPRDCTLSRFFTLAYLTLDRKNQGNQVTFVISASRFPPSQLSRFNETDRLKRLCCVSCLACSIRQIFHSPRTIDRILVRARGCCFHLRRVLASVACGRRAAAFARERSARARRSRAFQFQNCTCNFSRVSATRVGTSVMCYHVVTFPLKFLIEKNVRDVRKIARAIDLAPRYCRQTNTEFPFSRHSIPRRRTRGTVFFFAPLFFINGGPRAGPSLNYTLVPRSMREIISGTRCNVY